MKVNLEEQWKSKFKLTYWFLTLDSFTSFFFTQRWFWENKQNYEKDNTAQLAGFFKVFFLNFGSRLQVFWIFSMFPFTAFQSLLSVPKSCMSFFPSGSFEYLSASFSVFSLQLFNDIFWSSNSVICSKTAFMFSLFLVVVVFSFVLVSSLLYLE